MPNIFSKLAEVTVYSWITIAVVVVLSLIGLVLITKRNKKDTIALSTKTLVYGGLCVAVSFVLSYIRLYKMPQGGSITLASMFPVILYAMVFGPLPGIVAGVALGFLQFIQDPSMVHWAQFALDYPLAYGCLGLAGFAPKITKNLKVGVSISVCLAIIARGIMHLISGVIFFAEYAGDQPVVLYSLIYNASYIVPELIITLILAVAMVSTPVYSTLKKSTMTA